MMNFSTLSEPYLTRIATYKQTQEICKTIPTSAILTYKYSFQEDWKPDPRFAKTRVTVLPLDTFVAVQQIGVGKIACLNFADDRFPTGFSSTGSGAQEESLCYRSTLSAHIQIKHYPLSSNVLLYSPNVVVFKAPEENHFLNLDHPFCVDVISCPGVRHPQLVDGCMCALDQHIFRHKIEMILQVAYKEHVDHLVLGALGCGAWRNPPKDVAIAFKETLDRFQGMFNSIVFAVRPNEAMAFQEEDKLAIFTKYLATT